MRLLQLTTASGELLDLHPNVSVVTGLDAAQRARLAAAVTGLARGEAPSPDGLLEAHGVLFDLSGDSLRLLELREAGLDPIVRAADLPNRGAPSSLVRDLQAKEQDLADQTEATAAAHEAHSRARDAALAAEAVLERARRAVDGAEADARRRIDAVDELTRSVDQAVERRRRLEDSLGELRPRLEAAAAERAEVEEATAAVREARQAASAEAVDLAAQLDAVGSGRDPSAVSDAIVAREALHDLLARVEAERAIEAQDRDSQPAASSVAELEARLEEIAARRRELDRTLVAAVPSGRGAVEAGLERARAVAEPELVPSPDALALADAVDAIDAELGTLGAAGQPVSGVAESRNRLDDARQALLEAEQAARNPELDRGTVERLEHVHADLLDAIDRAEGRFGGARAQRKVDDVRAQEHALLDELGFTSYSDYMMGNSLLHVDPVKERALEQARVELSAAEDEWRLLQQQTDAELTRAARLDQRRGLVEDARRLLGRPVGATGVAEALRELRVESTEVADVTTPLRAALEAGGLAVGDEELDPEDLIALAEAWLEASEVAADQIGSARAEHDALDEEATRLHAQITAQRALEDAPTPEDPEVQREARVTAARAALTEAETRRDAHLEAEQAIAAVADRLERAVQAEQEAVAAAAGAEEAVASARATEDARRADHHRLEEELAIAARAEVEGNEELRRLSEQESASSPEGLAAAYAEASAAHEALVAEAEMAARSLAAAEAERRAVEAEVHGLRESVGLDPVESSSVREEIEWFLLARLAAQRSVSLGGSVPLLLDEALVGIVEEDVHQILDRLERMAEAVQVIVVSDDPALSSWALLAGADRAALVRAGAG